MTPFETPNLRLEPVGTDSAVLWLDVADRPLNVFNSQVLTDLDAALAHIANDRSTKLLFVYSAKPSGFIAGADLQEFATIRDKEEAVGLSSKGQALFNKLADLPQTTIVVVHGACLGGGLEFALACDYRLVVDHPKTQLGLPEIELGLLPAWGGTQRLPRVVGLEKALLLMLGRKRLSAREAFDWGLADALTTPENRAADLDSLAASARKQGKRPKERLPLRGWRQKFLESTALGRSLIFRGAERVLRDRVPDDMPAPGEALAAVREGFTHGMPAGFSCEREAIGRLAMTPACHNLISLFFQREKSRKLPAELRADQVVPIKRIGIVGAGTMGAGIAQLAAVKGFQVVIQEVNDAALAAGMTKIEGLFSKAVQNRVLSQVDATKRLGAIEKTTSYDGFRYVDLVVEAALEDLEIKKKIFRDLEQHVPESCFLATNTSSLRVESIQKIVTVRPERIAGLHFFNPVHKMPLVEVVRAAATDEATVATLTQWAIDLGKTAVVVKDSPGFLVNRILMPYLNEAVGLPLVDDWSVAEVDQLMRKFGMPMGPFQLIDQVGLDVAAHIEKTMRPFFSNRFEPTPIFEEMCQRGWLGEKTKIGFYRGRSKVNEEIYNLPFVIEHWMGSYPTLSNEPVRRFVDRLVLLMVNEAAACLAEEIAADAETIDLAMVFGTGWAPHRGGPLRYADDRGVANIVRELDELKLHGPRFEPCAELRRRAETREPFHKPLGGLAHVL